MKYTYHPCKHEPPISVLLVGKGVHFFLISLKIIFSNKAKAVREKIKAPKLQASFSLLIHFLTLWQWTDYLWYNWIIICIFIWELWSYCVWMLRKIIDHTVLILPQYISLIHKFNEINYCIISFLYKTQLLFEERLGHRSFLTGLSFSKFQPVLFWSLLNHVSSNASIVSSTQVSNCPCGRSAQVPKFLRCWNTQLSKYSSTLNDHVSYKLSA